LQRRAKAAVSLKGSGGSVREPRRVNDRLAGWMTGWRTVTTSLAATLVTATLVATACT
jgi:hypothetical protein